MTSDTASRFVTRLTAGILLLNLFVYALAAFTLYATWREYEMRVESSTQNLARVIESTVTGVVDKADVALRSVVDEAERQLAAGEIDAAAINGTIARQTARVPELDGIRLTNAAGDLLYGNGVDPAAPVTVTDREYFQWARDNPAAETYISKPYVGRIAQQWVFALARRVEHPDGRFAGVAVGVFPIKYFTDFFSAIDVGQDGTVVLRDDDMTVVSRFPEVEGAIGQTQVSPELTAVLAAGKPAATYTATGVMDNIRRIYSYQKISELPFYVFVGQSLGVMVEDWRHEALAMLLVLVLFTLVTIAGSRQLARSWRQQQQAELDLRLANQALEERVEERTSALRVSNEQLQVELAERRQVEAALLQAKETAEAANRAKSVFLANMSHELRTPLNAILGFSELMTRDAALTPDQRENLAIINRSGGHLLNLINDVLDMAKIEAGRTTLQEQDFDLHHLLAELVELFRARAEAKGLTLTLVQAPATPRLVHGDANKLRQVLINLLGNAIKFTAAGSVTLAVQVVAAADAATGQGCRLCFTVEDTGPGVAPEDLELIFEPFVQATRGGAIQEGTGLGLPISREYARLLGGALTVVSAGTPGQGSSFRLEAPLGMAAAPTPAPSPPAARRSAGLAAGQPDYRLLVVDDRAESRKLLADLLTGLGFAVRTAENGAEAVTVWAEWRPHLIWMDLRMPVMDGHEATRRIKAMPAGQQTVIVAVSANVLNDEQTGLHGNDCDDYVRKPYRESEIVACLVKHLGVRMVYADAPPATPAVAPAFDLTGLPAAWVEQVRQAAVAADAAQLNRLAAAVEREWPIVATVLCTAVDDFDYNRILTAIDQSRET